MRWRAFLGREGGRFGRARGGNVAILVALGSTALMSLAAIGVDLGLAVQTRRQAQGAVDVAAMLATIDLANAIATGRQSLADNGYGRATSSVALGSYDATGAMGARFRTDGGQTNAVQVKLTTMTPYAFGKAVGLPGSVPVQVTATAAAAQFAAFSVGSGLVGSDGGGIANAVLGALLGARLTLQVGDYTALATARIDGLRVLDALGSSLGLQAASYSQILQAKASVGQVVMALRSAAQGNAAATAALTGLLNALPNAGNLIPLSQLDALADAAALAPARGLAGPSVQVMGMIAAAASIANGQNQVAIDLGSTIPGLLTTRLTLAIGERRRSSGWVRPGTASATVKTAQTRLLIEATLSAPLGLGQLSLPLYAALAPAQGTLRSLSCAPSNRQVVIDGQTGLGTLAIANIARTAINGGDTGPDLSQPATVLSLPLIQVTGKAQATLGSGAQTMTFNEADIAGHTVRTISSGNVAQSLTGSLLASLALSVNGIGRDPSSSRARGDALRGGSGPRPRPGFGPEDARPAHRLRGLRRRRDPLRAVGAGAVGPGQPICVSRVRAPKISTAPTEIPSRIRLARDSRMSADIGNLPALTPRLRPRWHPGPRLSRRGYPGVAAPAIIHARNVTASGAMLPVRRRCDAPPPARGRRCRRG